VAKLTIYRRRDSEELPDLAVLVNDFRIRLTSLYAVIRSLNLIPAARNWNWINETRTLLPLPRTLFAKHHGAREASGGIYRTYVGNQGSPKKPVVELENISGCCCSETGGNGTSYLLGHCSSIHRASLLKENQHAYCK